MAKDDDFPCLGCGKPVKKSGYSIACTICGLWCHKECTGLTDEVFKFIQAQFKANGVTYWGCRACTSFAKQFHSKLGEMNKRMNEIDSRTTKNTEEIQANKDKVKKIQEEIKELREERDGAAERSEEDTWEEMRDRESRRRNLVIHRVKEPVSSNYKEAQLEDRESCGAIFHAIGLKYKPEEIIIHNRRVGEKGANPRPIVVTIATEEERRKILNKAKLLADTELSEVGIVPDLTWKQRQAEENLWKVAEEKNKNLSEDDRSKNLRWTVAGPRGEKRLTKGLNKDHPATRGLRGRGGRARGRPLQKRGTRRDTVVSGANALPLTNNPARGSRPFRRGRKAAAETEPETEEVTEETAAETETAEMETGSEDEYTEAMEEEVVVRKRTLVKRVREAGDSGEDLAPPEKR